MIDDVLWDLDHMQAQLDYWPCMVPGFDPTAFEEAEAELWLIFSRDCYALESEL